MKTQKIKEYEAHIQDNFYSFLTKEDFTLRKRIKIKQLIMGKEKSKELGIKLVQLFDLPHNHYDSIDEKKVKMIEEKARELIFEGADLTVSTTDFIYMGDFFLHSWSALDMVWNKKPFEKIKELLLRCGAEFAGHDIGKIIDWSDTTNGYNTSELDDKNSAEELEDLINKTLYNVDIRLDNKLRGNKLYGYYYENVDTPLISAVKNGRLQCVKTLLKFGANPFYRSIVLAQKLNKSNSFKTVIYDNTKPRKTALELAKDYKKKCLKYLETETDEKKKEGLTKKLFINNKIIKYLEEYEFEWKKQNKFIPEEYYDKSMLCYVKNKRNSTLTKKDVNSITYKVIDLSNIEQKDKSLTPPIAEL